MTTTQKLENISDISAYEILDSRGYPTLEAQVWLDNGVNNKASVPSGASTGSREALELRDLDPKRYQGKGVLKAAQYINLEIKKTLIGRNVYEQQALDELMIELDGTEHKSRLGANAILAVSLALAKTAATNNQQPLYRYLAQLSNTQQLSLPVPLMNIINGGVHADNNLAIQEFMIVPVGATSFSEALRWGSEVFHALKSLLKKQGLNTNVGDEGGFAPNLRSHEQALDKILEAIVSAGYRPGHDIYLALDAASNEFYRDHRYQLENRQLTREEWLQSLLDFVENYPIISIEDGMAEDDWEGWRLLTEALRDKIQLVGDDLFVTNTELLTQGIERNVANAILIKPNQIGTLTETFSAIELAKQNQYATIISHRSGETEETFIADLAVAVNAGQIKTGSISRTDRVSKYNQLLRIEYELNDKTFYSGFRAFSKFIKFPT